MLSFLFEGNRISSGLLYWVRRKGGEAGWIARKEGIPGGAGVGASVSAFRASSNPTSCHQKARGARGKDVAANNIKED